MKAKRRMSAAALLLAVAASLGCATAGAGGGGGGGGGANVLTNETLVEANELDAYLALERLRPQWLRPRGQASVTSATAVALFIDGSPRGSVANLRGMQVNDILDVTYLSASEAAFQFGTVAGNGGALAVRTRR